MSRNVDVKARVANLDALGARAAAIADSGPVEIVQDDTFFACPNGRLKLREFSPTHGELIFYQRADSTGPKESRYVLAEVGDPASLRGVLAAALGICGRVRKRRRVFLAGKTRIHLDDVEGLGHFLELEVVLDDHESVEAGSATARDLMTQLSVPAESLVAGAYVDLLSQIPNAPDGTSDTSQ